MAGSYLRIAREQMTSTSIKPALRLHQFFPAHRTNNNSTDTPEGLPIGAHFHHEALQPDQKKHHHRFQPNKISLPLDLV
jgi:hypothetical protein